MLQEQELCYTSHVEKIEKDRNEKNEENNQKWNEISLVKRIICGLVIGIILWLAVPHASVIGLLGGLFVGALRAVAPLLVLFLVMGALSQQREGKKSNMKRVIFLYLLGTFLAGCVAVAASFLFPVTITLTETSAEAAAPSGIGEVLNSLLMSIVSNPVDALANANYLGILAWAVLLGIALRKAGERTKNSIMQIADAFSTIVQWIISFAPFGVLGLVFSTISEQGLSSLLGYGKLILLLVGSMAFVAFVVNPLITFACIRKNPYPLVLKCLKDSGITAFFTRSSAANIPVNMKLCEELGLDRDTILMLYRSRLAQRSIWAAPRSRSLHSLWRQSIHSGYPWIFRPLSSSACSLLPAPAGHPALREVLSSSCLLHAVCSASRMTLPCRWSEPVLS